MESETHQKPSAHIKSTVLTSLCTDTPCISCSIEIMPTINLGPLDRYDVDRKEACSDPLVGPKRPTFLLLQLESLI